MNDCGYLHPVTPFTYYLRRMLHQDRKLYLAFFNRIPEVYGSYWPPLREMARHEKGVLRKGLLYGYLLYAYCFGKYFRKVFGAMTSSRKDANSWKV